MNDVATRAAESTGTEASTPDMKPDTARDTALAPHLAPAAEAAEISTLLDRQAHALIAGATRGLSPAALAEAWADWGLHLATSPGRLGELGFAAFEEALRLAGAAAVPHAAPPRIAPQPRDRRFRDDGWSAWPFNLYADAFLATERWWQAATNDLRGVAPENARLVSFTARQMLDAFAPSNALATNPAALRETIREGGLNLVRGAGNFAEDAIRQFMGQPPVGTEAFELGETLATTPGRVVYRNHLIELLQYSPTTGTVHPEPILIVPAWIMKYYILDLTAQNSLIAWLVAQGFTVFAISWRNPGPEDRDLGMDDYRLSGVMEALRAAGGICGGARIHALGYCLGGTLLSIAAAAMGRGGDHRLASLTLVAAQTDFTEAGELKLFISEAQLTFLEDMMADRGGLEAGQMAGAFQMLRSNDLIWSRVLNTYLLGQRAPMDALTAWSADATRMPARMHSEYLRRLFLNNDLAEGRIGADGQPVTISEIAAPILAVGTETDHVAPWHSVWKIQLQAEVPVTFLLTSGGHNTGIAAPPGTPRRHYRVATRHPGDPLPAPDHWLAEQPSREGSWWPALTEWLAGHSGPRAAPPPMGGAAGTDLGPAPGTYVRAD